MRDNSERAFLIAFIQQTYPVPDNIANDIAAHFKKVYFSKNEFIVTLGKVCDAYIFLEEGFARAYTFDTEGNDVTTNFFIRRSIILEPASFFKRTPARENIQALTESVGWQVNFEELNYLFHSVHNFRELGRMILINGFITLKERMLSMINETTEQRYEQLLLSQPEIFQFASLKNISSFLGITDTSLSRIRKKYAS